MIRGEGEQMAEFAHQIGFRQPLGRKAEDALAACQLPEKAALGGIEMHFEHLIAQARTQIVVIAPKIEPPVGAGASKPATGHQIRKDPRKARACRLPIPAVRCDPSARPRDRLVRGRDLGRRCWEYADSRMLRRASSPVHSAG